MQICVSKFTIIGSDNGLSPIRRQAIIWTNAGILLIQTFGTNFSEILIQIHICSNKKMHLKMSSGKCWPFCLGLNVLIDKILCKWYILICLIFTQNFKNFMTRIWSQMLVLMPRHKSIRPSAANILTQCLLFMGSSIKIFAFILKTHTKLSIENSF